MMTDADFDRELERRVQAATNNGETLKVTLTKDEIEEFAQRKFFGNGAGDDIYAEVLEEILALDVGDIMAVLKCTMEVAKETLEAVDRVMYRFKN